MNWLSPDEVREWLDNWWRAVEPIANGNDMARREFIRALAAQPPLGRTMFPSVALQDIIDVARLLDAQNAMTPGAPGAESTAALSPREAQLVDLFLSGVMPVSEMSTEVDPSSIPFVREEHERPD